MPTQLPSNWQSTHITANGIRVHYTRTGGDKPPFVLAHGFSDDGLCWAPVAMALEADYDVIMVDARGHGQSQAPEAGYDGVEMAKDLAGVITGLGLKKPLIMGHSMGAATALTLAGMFPELPGAILLEDPPARWKIAVSDGEGVARQDAWLRGMRSWITELQKQSREEIIASQQQKAPTWSPLEVELWADAHLRMALNIFNDSGPRPQTDLNQIKSIICPTLLITAETARGAIVSAEDAAELGELVPQLKVQHIAGAGHCIHREQFEPFMEVVRQFLDF
jgi:pimeloyl-ACP methyl ester carboxylesterase